MIRSKIHLLTIALLFPLVCLAQKTPSKSQVDAFFNSETYIVYQGSLFSSYNIYLKDAIDNDWTITPATIISYGQFEEKRKQPNTSFLVVSYGQFEGDNTGTKYEFLNLLQGGDYYSLTEMPDLVNIPLCLSDQNEESYVHKLNVLIRFIQKHMLMLQAKPELCNKDFNSIFKKNTDGFANKTLLLCKEELDSDINSIAKIKKVYPYPFKLISQTEIEKAIASKEKNSIILHIVGPDSPKGNRKCLKALIGTDDAEIYYFDYHIISSKNPSRFLKKDLDKIAH